MLDHSRQMPATDDEGIVIPDVSDGLIDRSIYSDPQLYRLELQRIFARAWNFMCHETQIPDAGDYFINYIGEDQVIVVRGEDGQVRGVVEHLPPSRQCAVPGRAWQHKDFCLQLPRLDLRPGRQADRHSRQDGLLSRRR